jgi:predicted O-methyltransferase YrrM
MVRGMIFNATALSNRPRIFAFLHRLGLVQSTTPTLPEERHAVRRHVRGRKIAIEIGTYMGATAAEMASELAPGGTLYCIDPYRDGDMNYEIAQRHILRQGLADRVKFLRCDAATARALLPRAIEFAFIDGDHSYEGLKADWTIVRQLLAVGGIAAFHDTARIPGDQPQPEQSIRFYDEVIAVDPDFAPVERVFSLNVLRRMR